MSQDFDTPQIDYSVILAPAIRAAYEFALGTTPKQIVHKKIAWEDTWDSMEFAATYEVYGEEGRELGLYNKYLTL